MTKYGKLKEIEEISMDEDGQTLKLVFENDETVQERSWPELADGKSLRDHLWNNSEFVSLLKDEPDMALLLIDILSRRTAGPNLRYEDVATEEFKAEVADILESEVLYEGWFKLLRLKLRYQRFDGEWSEPHEHVGMFGSSGVSVLLYDPQTEHVVLVEEFRQGAAFTDNPFLLGLAGGGVGKEESPKDAAIREAKEEAGATVYDIQHLMTYYVSPGFTDNRNHTYVGFVDSTKVGGVHGLEHENENIRVKVMPLAEALSLISEGKLVNGPAMTALLYFGLHKDSILKIN
jgi:ADP-ribose pyrophosphatase